MGTVEFAHFPFALSAEALSAVIGTPNTPLIFDVRRAEAFDAAADVIPTALWRDHRDAQSWGAALPAEAEVLVYCKHGHEVSQAAAAALRALGRRARYLAGGIEGYRATGGLLVRKDVLPHGPENRPSRWVTRARPKIDRIACPWFIRRFLDREAAFHFVEAEQVEAVARELGAEPFDVPDVAYSHDGSLCSFDAFLARSGIEDSALDHLALIVRGADTAQLDLAPQAAGLLAVSLGLSASVPDDWEMLERGLPIYDAFYAWCRHAAAETHGWPPRA